MTPPTLPHRGPHRGRRRRGSARIRRAWSGLPPPRSAEPYAPEERGWGADRCHGERTRSGLLSTERSLQNDYFHLVAYLAKPSNPASAPCTTVRVTWEWARCAGAAPPCVHWPTLRVTRINHWPSVWRPLVSRGFYELTQRNARGPALLRFEAPPRTGSGTGDGRRTRAGGTAAAPAGCARTPAARSGSPPRLRRARPALR